jgi:hypothetical protein
MLLDIRMPMRTGLEVMQACADCRPAYPIVREAPAAAL